MQIPKACQPIEAELEAARKVLEQIQGSPEYIQGPGGSQPGKPNPGLLREAEEQEAKIGRLAGELNKCLKAHGVDPDLLTTFEGTASLSAPQGSGHHRFSFTLEFHEPHHKTLSVFAFPSLKVEAGGHTLTIIKTGGGNGHFDPATGKLDLQIDLRIDAAWPGGHMTLGIDLSTEHEHGSRLDHAGAVTIAGTTVGHGSGAGFPDHVDVTLIAKGAIKPRP